MFQNGHKFKNNIKFPNITYNFICFLQLKGTVGFTVTMIPASLATTHLCVTPTYSNTTCPLPMESFLATSQRMNTIYIQK